MPMGQDRKKQGPREEDAAVVKKPEDLDLPCPASFYSLPQGTEHQRKLEVVQEQWVPTVWQTNDIYKVGMRQLIFKIREVSICCSGWP